MNLSKNDDEQPFHSSFTKQLLETGHGDENTRVKYTGNTTKKRNTTGIHRILTFFKIPAGLCLHKIQMEG